MFLSIPSGLFPFPYVADTPRALWLQSSETNPPIHNSPFLFQDRSAGERDVGLRLNVWIIPLSLDTRALWRSITSQTLHPLRLAILSYTQNSQEIFEVISKFTRFTCLKLISFPLHVRIWYVFFPLSNAHCCLMPTPQSRISLVTTVIRPKISTLSTQKPDPLQRIADVTVLKRTYPSAAKTRDSASLTKKKRPICLELQTLQSGKGIRIFI